MSFGEMLPIVGNDGAVHKDVIKEDKNKFTKEIMKNMVHEERKERWYIGRAKRYNEEPKWPWLVKKKFYKCMGWPHKFGVSLK